jgi:hypothetical protein
METMHILTFMKGVALGAGFMYLFDPSRGRTRRARIRDKAVHVWNEAGESVESCTRDFANRTQGVIHDLGAALTPGGADRTEIGLPRTWLPANWSPAMRMLATAGAGLLALYGKRRGDMLGTALGAISVGVISNAMATKELRRTLGVAPALPLDETGPEDSTLASYESWSTEHRSRTSSQS